MSEHAHILVVDDEPHPRLITVRLLERAGYTVAEATTGQEGLRLARELRPDLILLDVVLPDLDGFEVCRRIKADPELAHILVILLSGKRIDSESMVEGVTGGANGYILRGTPTRELLARVEAWLRIQRMEHRLRESESWRELAISGFNGGIWHLRLDPDDPTHALPEEVYLSPHLKQFIGYEEDEFPNSIVAWERRVHPEDLPKLRDSSTRHRRGETELHELEYRIRHKDGSQRWLHTCGRIERDVDGRPVRFAGMDWDITERKSAEEALRRERDLVARIMETSPVGIVVLDREGQITFVNAQIEQITGLTREQIVQLEYNDPTWQMVDQTGRPLPDDRLPFPRLMREGQPIYDLQQVVELPSIAGIGPRRLHLSMNAAPLYDASGQADGVVVTVEDVTERVQLQDQVEQYATDLEQRVAERTVELQASQAALLRAERLAIAGKLAASLTHEISNPLQSVIGCLGLAQETLDEGGDVREYLEIALPELRRVARIVARLRNLGRPPSPLGPREPTDVGKLLEKVQALVRKQCQNKRIALDWERSENLPPIYVVPDQIQQVFLNLTLNAIEAIPGEGRIEVRTALVRKAGDEPAGVRISFQDSGLGISHSALPHVFDPFYSTKPEGLGLGLSISQDIAQQHGGRIEVKSELGQGATFTVWLPALTSCRAGGCHTRRLAQEVRR